MTGSTAHDPVIVAARRSPVAPRGGVLARLDLAQLGAPVLRAALMDARVPVEAVDEVILGNALGAGGNPARLVALAAGLPQTVTAMTVDRQCCSGLDAVILAARAIRAGEADVVIAGGVESFSRAPVRMHRPLQKDGVPVPYDRPAFAPPSFPDPDPAEAAAALALQMQITREEQEAYARASHAAALRARASGYLAAESVPLAGLEADAFTRPLDSSLQSRLPVLAGESVYGLTASTIAVEADAAALLVLMSRKEAERRELKTLADVGQGVMTAGDPANPAAGVHEAALELFRRTGASLEDISVMELMEAFAVQAMVSRHALGLGSGDLRVNLGGGALARGHPIGASGAILAVRLAHILARDPAKETGLAAIAAAGGLGTALFLRSTRG
ncbi:thiolase family protein [Pannonibacter phragmitetus]|uniref:thiolase family protein n=1 Tax=Pannonibacter phragmitetus TaxID=121719 RepID=UPI003D2F31F4